jgi:hypothetical protein
LSSSKFSDRYEESSGQEPGTWMFITGILTFELSTGRPGHIITRVLFAEDAPFDDGAETLRLRRGSLLRNDPGLSFESSMREGLSLELVFFGANDATDFGFDSEPDEGLEPDGECNDLDSPPDGRGDSDWKRDDLVLESEGRVDSDADCDALSALELEVGLDCEWVCHDLDTGSDEDFDDGRDDFLLESERSVRCDVLDSESDESVNLDRECDDFCLGCSGATEFGVDSESDASLDFNGACDDFFSGPFVFDPESAALSLECDCDDFAPGRSGAADFGLDSESDDPLEGNECDDVFSGRIGAADFGLASERDNALDLDEERADLDRAPETSDLMASLDRVTE